MCGRVARARADDGEASSTRAAADGFDELSAPAAHAALSASDGSAPLLLDLRTHAQHSAQRPPGALSVPQLPRSHCRAFLH